MDRFEVLASYKPTGDQPQAIEKLVNGIRSGAKEQILLGVTGSGKTFTMANVIAQVNKPTLILAHNKTLAAQLCGEMREIFPNNAVEYFVSYYDYYQPEAYIPSTDTYLEKDSSINDDIDKMRHSATCALTERRDVIVVSSVSCIYGLGNPSEYRDLAISIRPGMMMDREELCRRLVDIQYERNDMEFARNAFRVRGDTVEIFPAGNTDVATRIEFFGDEVDRVSEIEALTGRVKNILRHTVIFPASHYATSKEKMEPAIEAIERDLLTEAQAFKEGGKLLEEQRLRQRTQFDIEMLREIGYCSGIENYSRYMDGRSPGEPPFTLLDYFPDDFLLIIDESHVSVPQIRAMYAGDRSRKQSLVDYGFRLNAAYDNRPLKFEEFEKKVNQVIYVSATPGPYEKQRTDLVAEQIIRPTGLLDPEIAVRPCEGQVDDLLGEIRTVISQGYRVLVTTLTKKMAENLTAYMADLDIKVRYLHSDVETIERMEIIRDLRSGAFDVLVGINLLREGLDLPEVALVAILDADKEGFLRSETSLVQTIGRAARNAEGRVIMYADVITESMERAIGETNRRRGIQSRYNEEHGIVPRSIQKKVHDVLDISSGVPKAEEGELQLDGEQKAQLLEDLEKAMLQAAAELDFERAAKLRDQWLQLKGDMPAITPHLPKRPTRRSRAERTRK